LRGGVRTKMNNYENFLKKMTDEKAIQYMYENGYFDLKIADYITKRLKEINTSLRGGEKGGHTLEEWIFIP